MIFRTLQKLLAAPSFRRRRAAVCAEVLETRTLLTNISFSAGNLIVGGGAVDNAYQLSFDGTNYTIVDLNGNNITSGTVTDVDGVVNNSFTFDPTALAGFSRITVNGNAGTDSLEILSFRGGNEGLTVGATVESAVVSTSIGSAGNRAANTVVFNAPVSLNAGAGIFTSSAAVTFNAAVTLGANVEINGTGASQIGFASTLNGNAALTLTGSNVIFTGAVGGVTPTGGLDITATGFVTISSASVLNGTNTVRTNAFNLNANVNGNGVLEVVRTTAGNQSFSTVEMNRIGGGFSQVRLGNANTNTFTIPTDSNDATDANIQSNTVITGGSVVITESLMQTGSLTINVDTLLQFSGAGSAKGTGALTINETGNNALTVTGNLGRAGAITHPWGAAPLTVTGTLSSDITFTGEVGNSFTSITANAGILRFNNATAITSSGSISLTTASRVELNGGVYSATGSVTINGPLLMTGNILLKGGAGQSVLVNGAVSSSGPRHNITVRGEGAALGTVTFTSFVSDAANFFIDSSGANTALNVNVAGVDANAITLRGVTVNLRGAFAAATGNIDIIGAANLVGNTGLLTSGGTRFSRFQGTVDGGFDLTMNAGTGKATFLQTVGGTTPLANLTVNAAGAHNIVNNITVANNFSWTLAEVVANGDNLQLLAGRTITAGNSILIDVADAFINRNGLNTTNGLLAPSVTVIQGGNP